MNFKKAFSIVFLSLHLPSISQSKIHEYDHYNSESLSSPSVTEEHATDPVEFDLKVQQFHTWKEQVGKSYKSTLEETERLKVWLDNHDYIEQHNSKEPKPSYTLGHNFFSDMTLEEYHQYNFLGEFSPGIRYMTNESKINLRGSVVEASVTTSRVMPEVNDVEDSINWVDRGAVTPVKNQGMCGACWAFSAIAAIEGARYVEGKGELELQSLSEQQLLDCDYQDHSCLGGLMDTAFTFGESVDGFCSEEDWPYAMHRHHLLGCRHFKDLCTVVPNTRVKTFEDITNSTLGLKAALMIQPASVAIQASGSDFQLYSSGVFDVDCGVDIDHGVTAVGYGAEDGKEFWLIKNSWGATWGESGYMKMSIESNNEEDEGQCGIQSFASIPILDF